MKLKYSKLIIILIGLTLHFIIKTGYNSMMNLVKRRSFNVTSIYRNKKCYEKASVFDPDCVEFVFSKWRQGYPRDQLLTVPPYLGFGNQMFQYASMLGIALRNGKRPFTYSFSLITVVFNVSFVDDLDRKLWPRIYENKYAAYDPELEYLPGGNCTVVQFLQSWKYFEPIRTHIQNEFQFSEQYERLRREAFTKYTDRFKDKVIVALHVRRGDMIENPHGHKAAPLSYIRKAVQHMKSKFGNPVFLLATDDKEWCVKHVNGSDIVIMNNPDPVVDFGALTLCDHMIMTVGTFGWWAAWLIDGYTVYYRDYPIPGSWLDERFVKEDYFLPHWVPIGD